MAWIQAIPTSVWVPDGLLHTCTVLCNSSQFRQVRTLLGDGAPDAPLQFSSWLLSLSQPYDLVITVSFIPLFIQTIFMVAVLCLGIELRSGVTSVKKMYFL